MKTRITLLVALLSLGIQGYAQEQAQTTFHPHAFLQFQGGRTHTLGEGNQKDLHSWAAQFAVGYQISPVWAARLAVNGWESKGGYSLNGIQHTYKWNYITPAVDVKFNLINACYRQSYNPKRIFGLNIIGGIGANIGFNNNGNNILKADPAMENYWTGTQVLPVGRIGLDFDFRCSKRISINLEAMSNFTSDKYNSQVRHRGGNLDWYFTALLGLKVNLGKVENAATAVAVAPVAVLPAAPAESQKEVTPPASVPAMKLIPAKTREPEQAAKEVLPARVTPEMQTEIFFSLASATIPAASQPKINNLAQFMKNNPETKVYVTGYADAQTGNARVNAQYARQRAEAVAEALQEAGIDPARIVTDSKGDTVQIFPENRKNRVSICVAK